MRGKRPAFDTNASYVARVRMLVAGLWLKPGDPVTAGSKQTLRRLYEMRPPRIMLADEQTDATEGAGSAAGLNEGAEHADELASLPSERDADPQDLADTADDGRKAEPSAPSPIPGQEALPEGWRDLHGNAIKAMARSLNGGKTIQSKEEAVAVLEAYESGRAA